MELNEFIAETLAQISQGISFANERMDTGASANPPFYASYSGQIDSGISNRGQEGSPNVITVKFDVAVTEASSAEGGGKIAVMGIGIGGSVDSESTIASRIKFNLPLAIPTT